MPRCGELKEETGSCEAAKESALPGNVITLLHGCMADIEALKQRQDLMAKRQEEANAVTRGQLNSIADRVSQGEKDLHQAQERQGDAIEKATAAFHKHVQDAELERQNLLSVISQANHNFEHLSSEIAQRTAAVNSLEQGMVQLQGVASRNAREARNSATSLRNDLTSIQHAVQQLRRQDVDLELLEQTIYEQHQQIKDLQIGVHSVHDAMVHFTEIEVEQLLTDKLVELQGASGEASRACHGRSSRSPRAIERSNSLRSPGLMERSRSLLGGGQIERSSSLQPDRRLPELDVDRSPKRATGAQGAPIDTVDLNGGAWLECLAGRYSDDEVPLGHGPDGGLFARVSL